MGYAVIGNSFAKVSSACRAMLSRSGMLARVADVCAAFRVHRAVSREIRRRRGGARHRGRLVVVLVHTDAVLIQLQSSRSRTATIVAVGTSRCTAGECLGAGLGVACVCLGTRSCRTCDCSCWPWSAPREHQIGRDDPSGSKPSPGQSGPSSSNRQDNRSAGLADRAPTAPADHSRRRPGPA